MLPTPAFPGVPPKFDGLGFGNRLAARLTTPRLHGYSLRIFIDAYIDHGPIVLAIPARDGVRYLSARLEGLCTVAIGHIDSVVAVLPVYLVGFLLRSAT